MPNTDFFNQGFDFSDTPETGGELFLIFVTKVGEVNEQPIYEFLFSEDPDSACGPQWENICEFQVEPPQEQWVQKTGRLAPSELVLTLLEELDNFRYLDGVFGAISLAFEYIEDYSQMDNLNAGILKFGYGESMDVVLRKLKERGLELELS